MSSRKEQKEKLRQERVAREQAQAQAAARRRRFQIGGGVILAAVAVVVVVVLLVSGGSSNSGASPGGSNSNTSGSGTQAGLETGAAPWPPEYSFLAQRLAAYNFPQQSDIGYHEHAKLFIYVNGKQVTVPANFGIDPQGRFIAPLHTHDTTGVIHMESEKPYPFTLGEAINIWGVKFTNDQLGGYKAGVDGNVLELWANGKKVADPVNYKMKRHDILILGYGKPGSFPTKKSYTFEAGL